MVAGNSARTTSVASIVTQEGVHADEAAAWLGLGRRRDPGNAPPPPPATRSLREALEASAVPTQRAAGQTTARKSMREPAERYQRELPPPPPVAPSSEPEAPTPPPPPPPVATQTDSRRLGRRHFGSDVHATRPEGLLVWDELAHEAAVKARGPTSTRVSVRARQGAPAAAPAPAPAPPPELAEAGERAATDRLGAGARTSLGRVIGLGDAL